MAAQDKSVWDGALSTLINDNTSGEITPQDVRNVFENLSASILWNAGSSSLAAVTPATDDKVVIRDTSDSNNLKTITVQEIVNLAGGGFSVTGTTDNGIITYDNASGDGVVESALTFSGNNLSFQNDGTIGTSGDMEIETDGGDLNITTGGGAVTISTGGDEVNISDDLTVQSSLTVDNNITVAGTVDGRNIATDGTKLDGIEAGADVTDFANVNAAGATMTSDTSVSGNSWFLDEDDMSSNDATKVPSQQSVKAYVDNNVLAGTYTPTITDVANTSSRSVRGQISYVEYASFVIVFGAFNIQATSSSTETKVRWTLPVSTSFISNDEASGVGTASGATSDPDALVTIYADLTNNELELAFNSFSTSGVVVRWQAVYEK